MDRTDGLGGTDMAHIFDLGKWYCSRRLYYVKTSQPEDYPDDSKAGLFALGHALEPECKRRYVEQTGAHLEYSDKWYAQHKNILDPVPDFVRGHPDGIIDHPSRTPYGVLECKTFGGNAWLSMIWAEGIPKAYLMQLQFYLWQTDLTWAAWACLNRDTGEFLTFDVDRDERIIKSLQKAAAGFWEAVTTRTAPEGWMTRHTEDKAPCGDCPYRYTCLEGVKASEAEEFAERRKAKGDLVELEDDRLTRLVAKRDSIAAPLKRAKVRSDALGAAIKARLEFMGHPDGVFIGGRKITASEQVGRLSWDTKAMAADGLDLSKYQSRGKPSRSLRIGVVK